MVVAAIEDVDQVHSQHARWQREGMRKQVQGICARNYLFFLSFLHVLYANFETG